LNGVGGNQNGQSARANRHVAFREKFAQPFHGAAHALLRGVIGNSCPNFADFAQIFVFKIAEQNRAAVGFVECGHRVIQQRFDLRPIVGGRIHVVHLHGDLFAQLAARFFADGVNRGSPRNRIKPRG
jgi:hypothetical protein